MWTTIVAILGSLGGLSAVVVALLFFKEIKKRKQADTRSIDIDNLSKTIKQLEKDRDYMQLEIKELKQSLRMSDAEKIGIERELNIHRRAVNSVYECSILPDKCPILLKLKELKQ